MDTYFDSEVPAGLSIDIFFFYTKTLYKLLNQYNKQFNFFFSYYCSLRTHSSILNM